MSDLATSPDYRAFLAELKARVRHAQLRAALSVNQEMILLYWSIGQDIRAQQAALGWGSKVIPLLAQYLRVAFPDMRGFSERNLRFMRQFAEVWPDPAIVKQLVSQLRLWG
ncbi:MAG: hypothetical protein AUK47_22150 [Deltaproteobacteria bacterium CG2_30_63_29]|nr:MAG: hypothetical protein AUK47_22150 [Deltaproteobacteria bacterium CG2_30_63_29]PJB42251.1 MAG: hypothetical protein CO108_12005 [Deltaproteobacteria bacterium CG_4_9_14_3_um_filter_63_12]